MPFQSINARPPLPSSPTSKDNTDGRDHLEGSHSEAAGERDPTSSLDHDETDNSDSDDDAHETREAHKDEDSSGEHRLSPDVKKNGSSNSKSSGGKSSTDSKRSHNRAYQTLHTGSKIKHLKKKDGEPLWRVDIQYDFLAQIFHNDQPVFTNSYKETNGHTFADIYIDAMARSSKTSKVLCEKLLGDRKAGLNMAMVCLLVNVGRMNTTLNCKYSFPFSFPS